MTKGPKPVAKGVSVMTIPPETTSAVITVGAGRGFVVEREQDRLVITAAHCLPSFPPCHGASYLAERTYQALLGPLGEKPTVWTECLFVDPIADIAVLGQPDNQELSDEADAYDTLVETSDALRVGEVPDYQTESAWLLSLDRRWFRCAVRAHGGPLRVFDASEGIVGGMSGSPILADDGSAIGVVCISGGVGDPQAHTEGGPNPRLTYNLPAWFFRPRPKRKAPESSPTRTIKAWCAFVPRGRELLRKVEAARGATPNWSARSWAATPNSFGYRFMSRENCSRPPMNGGGLAEIRGNQENEWPPPAIF